MQPTPSQPPRIEQSPPLFCAALTAAAGDGATRGKRPDREDFIAWARRLLAIRLASRD